MTTEVVTVRPEDGLKAAARKMVEAGVSGLPVIDESGALVGIITEADFIKQEADRSRGRYHRLLDALFGEREIREQADTVAEAMTPHPVVIHEDAKVAEAAREMSERGVKRLPVVDGSGRLRGIVSRGDIVAAFVRPDEVIADQIRTDVVQRILMIDVGAVDVAVLDGVVQLRGETPTKSDARLLEELARRIEGVVRVEATLSWQMDDTINTESPVNLT